MTNPTPVAQKLGALLRRLSSNHDGEVLATVHAIIRTLNSAGSDLHALADKVEQTNVIPEADMKRLYQAGYDAGVAASEKQFYGNGDFRTVKAATPIGQKSQSTATASAISLMSAKRHSSEV
jgi:hypothetical protein